MTKLEKLNKGGRGTVNRFILLTAIYTIGVIGAIVANRTTVDFDVMPYITLEDKLVFNSQLIVYIVKLMGIFSVFALVFVCELIAYRARIHEYNMKVYLVRLLGKQDEEADDHDA